MARRKKTMPAPVPIESPQRKSFAASLSVGLLCSIIITLIVGGIPFGMGKYIELKSPGPYDSGAYVYSAKHLLDGAKLGVDENSPAQPCTLLANIIGVKLFGFNDTGPKIVQMMLQLAGFIFMFYTLYKVFGPTAAAIGTILAAVYLSAPVIAKFGNVKEQFMIPFMIAAACSWMHYALSKKRFWLVLCGAFAIVPYYFKPTGLSIGIALAFYLVIAGITEKNLKSFLMRLGLIFAGACLGLCIPASLFIWQGQMGLFWSTTPVVLLKMSLGLAILFACGVYAFKAMRQYQLLRQLKTVPSRIWLTGAVVIIVMLICCVLYIRTQAGYRQGDIGSYINDIRIVSFFQKIERTVTNNFNLLLHKAGLGRGGYLADSRAAIEFSELWPKIMRYYKVLLVPFIFALGSILAASITWVGKLIKKTKPEAVQTHVVWLLAIWWILDAAFVWVSPRSYEQYYLPLCGSAAVLSGYIVWVWSEKLKAASFKIPWLAAGLVAVVTVSCLSLPIFIGQRYSPDTGSDYIKTYKHRRRGFVQSLKTVKESRKAPWQLMGDYIRENTTEEDVMYVWGWVPGIYVQAERLSSASTASFSDMHIVSPRQLELLAQKLVREFEQQPPKYIVDSLKRHIPWNRLPLELWPIVPKGMLGNETAQYLPNNPQYIAAFDKGYSAMLSDRFGQAEAARYAAMKPFRDYVMSHYKPVNKREFGNHRLYERIESRPAKKP